MKRFWVIAPFDYRYPEQWDEIWSYDLENGVISLGWGDIGNVSGLSLEEILELFPGPFSDISNAGGHMLHKFYNLVKPGHRVIARRGTKQIAAIGTVKRRAYFDSKKHKGPYGPNTYWNHLDVKWDYSPRDVSFDKIVFGMQAFQEIQEARFNELTGSVPVNVEESDLSDARLDTLIRSGRLRIGLVPTDSPQALVRQRRGQARLRQLSMKDYGGRCAICDVADSAFLIASHIVGWAAAPKHQGKLSNVICLCRVHDALFEAGYWSLSDELKLLTKKAVPSKCIRELLLAMKSFRKPSEFESLARFLKVHRKKHGYVA